MGRGAALEISGGIWPALYAGVGLIGCALTFGPTTRLALAGSDGVVQEGPGHRLALAREAFARFDIEGTLENAGEVVSDPDAQIELRLDAHYLLGSAHAILGDIVAAEKQFRFLLRGRPDLDLDPETSPKILAIFRKVQAEERAIRAQVRELERAQTIAELELNSEVPETTTGGEPLVFTFRLRDRRGAVAAVSVAYRRPGETAYSSLALQLDEIGRWAGTIPGEATENEDGFSLEYFVATRDREGESLLLHGNADEPWRLRVEPGTVSDARPLWARPWIWIAAGAAVIATVVGLMVVYFQAIAVTSSPMGEYPVEGLE